ncbi:MAG: hypothetical protein U0841_04375 [Chloroflexia bacterium]
MQDEAVVREATGERPPGGHWRAGAAVVFSAVRQAVRAAMIAAASSSSGAA